MGVLVDYFAAPSDEIAASVVDRDGGPVAQPGAEGFDSVTGWGIDPVVQLGTLESLLTRIATTRSSTTRAAATP